MVTIKRLNDMLHAYCSLEEDKCGNRFKKNVGPSGSCEPASGNTYRDINPN